ncbi:CRISPR-associated helicase Cas3' [Allorhizocola rhizosphaerae]|uniref:CRISPR-associated helicase Cas3' n=1 Tax=Allorhizocola rhizosphaerae TaxID=1872709 RepID=UPI0013C2EF6D|nr:CRISPR-associated helicase Cas3' [Allorhizocola rhizosphaerae]
MSNQVQFDVRAFWGKAGQVVQGEVTVPHPLICHAIDTASVAGLLYETLVGPVARADLEEAFAPLGGAARVWVALFCGLHDLGKLSPAFQALRVDVATACLPADVSDVVTRLAAKRTGRDRTDTLHGVLTAYHLLRVLQSWGAPRDTALALAQALGGHHGRYFSAQVLANARLAEGDHGGSRWEPWVDELISCTAQMLELPDPRCLSWSEVRLSTAATVALAGLATVSDWIASGSIDKKTHAGADVDLTGYVALSRERAREQVIDRLGWTAWSCSPADTGFVRLFGQQPRPLQAAIEQLIAGRTVPGILVIEAPTGEGKTKAALQATVSLIQQLGLAGFFLAMPTRATSNQAFGVAEKLLKQFGPGLTVKLLHGTAAEYLAGRRAQEARADPIRAVEVGGDEPGGAQDAHVREWFTWLRGLLAPLAVGTIDRILQVGIRRPWAPVPLVGLSNRVVILDEVHSYDVHMSTILDRVLAWLGWLGVPVIILSATLPAARRTELVKSWYTGARRGHAAQLDLAPSLPGYPRALWLDHHGVPIEVRAEASPVNTARPVGLAAVCDEDLVGWALERAARGWGVAIVHNLVKRAEYTAEELAKAVASLPEDRRPKIALLTRHVISGERARIEAELQRLFGENGTRAPTSGYIVVGTQVLEQSLDLDFDAMASDVAPMDSIVQRAGRLHRFRRVDPDAAPTLAILGVREKPTGPMWARYTVNVYDDAVLLRTWALLRTHTELRLPDEVPELIDAVYAEPNAIDYPPGWKERWDRAAKRLHQARRTDRDLATTLYVPQPEPRAAVLRELTAHVRNVGQTRKPNPWSERDG